MLLIQGLSLKHSLGEWGINLRDRHGRGQETHP